MLEQRPGSASLGGLWDAEVVSYEGQLWLVFAGVSISSKVRKAAAMAADDHPIEIIDEVDFYRLL